MAGSKRTNIEGHTIIASPELIRELRRLSGTFLVRLFQEARDHGQTRVLLHEQPYTLHCRPDHTFTLESEGPRHSFV